MGAVTRFPIPLLVAAAYVVVLIFLFNARCPARPSCSCSWGSWLYCPTC